jgi:hypothetical protein
MNPPSGESNRCADASRVGVTERPLDANRLWDNIKLNVPAR